MKEQKKARKIRGDVFSVTITPAGETEPQCTVRRRLRLGEAFIDVHKEGVLKAFRVDSEGRKYINEDKLAMKIGRMIVLHSKSIERFNDRFDCEKEKKI
jgi:hypothetical protein